MAERVDVALGTSPLLGATTDLASALIATGSQVGAAVEARLAVHGVTLRQVQVLRTLAQVPGASITDLARAVGVTKQSMQILVRHLEQIGALARTGQAGSGNTSSLHLTAGGAAVIDSAQAQIDQVAAAIDSALSVEDRQALSTLLTRASVQVQQVTAQ